MKKSGREKISECDNVSVETKDGSFEGLLLPNPNPKILVLKLKSGYNIGIDKKNVVKLNKLEDFKGGRGKCLSSLDIKAEKERYKQKEGLPKIAILHTGGTIASEVDYETGGVVARFTPEELLGMFPELKDIANVTSEQVMSIMSEDIRFEHYAKIGRAVKREIDKGVKGVIIGHGTDTLAITAAALSFMFKDLPVPVILVGSQRSSDRGSTDANLNIVNAAYFIANSNFKGVGICMHGSSDDDHCLILPATKTKKMHTSRRDAFKAVNAKAIAKVDFVRKSIEFLHNHSYNNTGKMVVKDKFEDKVAIIKTYPNMHSHLIQTMIDKNYKGFVLEGSGIGQAPTNIKENEANYKALKRFIEKGGVVVLTSNCVFGRVHPHIYKNCRRLEEIGVIFGEDMLTETAFVKLAWLLGNYPKKEVPKLMKENLSGEFSSRTLYEQE